VVYVNEISSLFIDIWPNPEEMHPERIVFYITQNYLGTSDGYCFLVFFSLAARGSETPLNWHTRMEIAFGAGRGLAYLRSNENIIHGNVTSSNILLDANMNAKIADFGLSRLMTIASNSNVIATTDGCLVFTADDLLCATAEVMGKSTYGTVYKATLEDGKSSCSEEAEGANNKESKRI